MRAPYTMLGLTLALLSVRAASADLRLDLPLASSAHALSPSNLPVDSDALWAPAPTRREFCTGTMGELADKPVAPTSTNPTSGAPRSIDVPAPPSSLSLVLSAFGAVGAWHATRSARKWKAGFAPDWYVEHAKPVGHVVPFDLDWTALPLCAFDHPKDAGSSGDHGPADVIACVLANPLSLIPASTRAPPLLA